MQNRSYVVVLMSGGIDSTACINFYKGIDFEVEGIFIDYGQPSRIKEYDSVLKVAKHYDISVKKLVVKTFTKPIIGEVLGRNAFFVFTALMDLKKTCGTICLGIHKGTQYYDCSNKFVNQIQQLLDEYSHNTIKLGTPVIGFNKKEIIDYCIQNNVPIELTYSCELGKKQPCGECLTCKDLEVIYASTK